MCIGQTASGLNIRVDEHVKAARGSEPHLSNFVTHLITSKHNFDPNSDVHLIHSAGKGGNLRAPEYKRS